MRCCYGKQQAVDVESCVNIKKRNEMDTLREKIRLVEEKIKVSSFFDVCFL